MADLNLIPNVGVLATQTGVFIATAAVVKKLYLEPYLAQRKALLSKTSGLKDKMSKAKTDLEVRQEAVDQKMRESQQEIFQTMQQDIDSVLSSQEEQYAAAKQKLNTELEKEKLQITKSQAEEFKKIPQVAKTLSEKILQKVFHR